MMKDHERRSRRVLPAAASKLLAKDGRIASAQRLVEGFRLLNAELPMQQAAVLLAVTAQPGISQGELMARLQLSQAAVSRSLHALSSTHWKGQPGLGLVDQQPDPNDSRRLRNYLSERGLTAAQQLVDHMSGLQPGRMQSPTYMTPFPPRRRRGMGVPIP